METYATKRVKDEIGLEIISFLLKRVDLIIEVERDYLQVFELQKISNAIIVEHRQEVPKRVWYYYIAEYKLSEDRVKLLLVQNRDVRTLMFSEEY